MSQSILSDDIDDVAQFGAFSFQKLFTRRDVEGELPLEFCEL